MQKLQEYPLTTLLQTGQDPEILALASHYAPIIQLDANEPFRPLAAGYTIFLQDAQSPSFDRRIRLKRGRGHEADRVIEYAIWWDWDINHLYELEHIWVYVNSTGEIVNIEGSWHGDVKSLVHDGRIKVQGNHPVVCSEPGKHAFAIGIDQFRERQQRIPGITSRFAGGSGIVLTGLFDGEIWRTPPWDRLIHTYLSQFAFTPTWIYSNSFTVDETMLVPWPALRDWIPGRVHGWIDRLEEEITADQYRTLQITICMSPAEVWQAGALGMDMVQLNVGRNRLGLPMLKNDRGDKEGSNLISALRACRKAAIGAYLMVLDEGVIPWLVQILKWRDWSDYLMTGAANPAWLKKIKRALPHYRTVTVWTDTPDDAVSRAEAIGASYIHVQTTDLSYLTKTWIDEIRTAGLGIILGPLDKSAAIRVKAMKVEAVVVQEPDSPIASN
jgi:hypothetical protein